MTCTLLFVWSRDDKKTVLLLVIKVDHIYKLGGKKENKFQLPTCITVIPQAKLRVSFWQLRRVKAGGQCHIQQTII